MKKKILILCGLLVFVDQLIKLIIINNMYLYESISVIPKLLNFTFVQNDGGAFSILSGGRWFFIIAGIIGLIAITKFVLLDRSVSKFDMTCYVLVISGIIGNLIDRIFYGSVIDYIDFRIFGYDAPIFNFADICIVIGALMLIFILVIKGDSDESIYSRKRIK